MTASLPAAPSLEQLRKQAKDLLRAHRAGDPSAAARVAAHGPGLQHAYHEDLDYYEGRAYGLRASAQDGTAGAWPRSSAPARR